VKLVEGHWVSKCSLCVDGEVKTKCPAAPAQGTGVGERNRSLKRHAKRFAEQHGPGVCDHVAASQGDLPASGGEPAVSAGVSTAAAADEVLPPQGRPATANGGAPAASLPQVSIYSLSSQALHFQTLSAFPVEHALLACYVLCLSQVLAVDNSAPASSTRQAPRFLRVKKLVGHVAGLQGGLQQPGHRANEDVGGGSCCDGTEGPFLAVDLR